MSPRLGGRGSEPPFRILVVGKDALARGGLRGLAESMGFVVTADLDLDASQLAPPAEAAVLDLGPSAEGLEALRGLSARMPVLALLWADEQARDCLGAGARGVLPRESPAERLASALHAIGDGLLVVDASLADAVIRRPPAAVALVEPLTPRENEVLALLVEGLSNRGIAGRLGISEHTAKFHVNAILGKLGAQSRSEAVALAARLGLVVL